MKELSEMTTREFVDSLLHQNEYTKLDVYDELDKRTHGFNQKRVDALLDLIFNPFPFLNMTHDELDMRFGLMSIKEWNLLQQKPSPSLHTTVISEIDDSVKVRPKNEELFWYAYDILSGFGGYDESVDGVPYPAYILAVFKNNKALLDMFIERLSKYKKRIAVPAARDIRALEKLGLLAEYNQNKLANDIKKIFILKGMDKSISQKSLNMGLKTWEGTDISEATNVYKIFIKK